MRHLAKSYLKTRENGLYKSEKRAFGTQETQKGLFDDSREVNLRACFRSKTPATLRKGRF